MLEERKSLKKNKIHPRRKQRKQIRPIQSRVKLKKNSPLIYIMRSARLNKMVKKSSQQFTEFVNLEE